MKKAHEGYENNNRYNESGINYNDRTNNNCLAQIAYQSFSNHYGFQCTTNATQSQALYSFSNEQAHQAPISPTAATVHSHDVHQNFLVDSYPLINT